MLVRFTVRSTGDALDGDGEAVGPTVAGLGGANDAAEAAGAVLEQPLTVIASAPTSIVTLRARMDIEEASIDRST